MATSFSANQYQNAFYARRLLNWELPHNCRQEPKSLDGFTQIIASDRGHLLDGVPRSRRNPWGNFVGTWDLPRHIPGPRSGHPISRSTYAQQRLQTENMDAGLILTGRVKNTKRTTGNCSMPMTLPPLAPHSAKLMTPPQDNKPRTPSPKPPTPGLMKPPTPCQEVKPRTPTPKPPSSLRAKPATPCAEVRRSPPPSAAPGSAKRTPSPPVKPEN